MKKIFVSLITLSFIVAALFSISILPVSAATKGCEYSVVNAVYSGTKAKVTYNTEYYTISNGKTITFDAYFSNSLINIYKSNGVKLARNEILKTVRFDIHVYTKNGQCVNYKYGACDGGKFKVISNVKGIKQSEYKVKITAYVSNYKTLILRAGDNANLAMSLKYKIK